MDFDWILSILRELNGQPLFLILVVLALSFVSEDAVTVGTALLVSQDLLSLVLGFIAVNFAIIAGDGMLYGAGALAARNRRIRKLVAAPGVYRAKRWAEKRLGPILLATRFMPGTRLPTYTASGFFGFSFPYFIAVLTVSALLWTGLVFSAVILVGKPLLDMLGPWKWLGAVIILLFGLVFPHFIGPWVGRVTGFRKGANSGVRI